jgi:hypothetical protein
LREVCTTRWGGGVRSREMEKRTKREMKRKGQEKENRNKKRRNVILRRRTGEATVTKKYFHITCMLPVAT